MAEFSDRIAEMDAQGIDVEALSINPYWYSAERDAAAELIKIQNEKLAEFCAATPDRFVAFATVALQHPQLAVEQLEYGVKTLGLRGLSVGGSVDGQELADPKFHPVWAKAEELGILIFMHPLGTRELEPSGRLKGSGLLTNTIGNPLETTIALSHLIFEGTLDRFPGLKICAAHGGGYLPSYANRSDAVITTFPNRVGPLPKKKPTQYLKDGQLYFDSIVFTPGGDAPPGRRKRGRANGHRHRLSVPVEQGPRRSYPVDPGLERRRAHRDSRRHGGEAARHNGLNQSARPADSEHALADRKAHPAPRWMWRPPSTAKELIQPSTPSRSRHHVFQKPWVAGSSPATPGRRLMAAFVVAIASCARQLDRTAVEKFRA